MRKQNYILQPNHKDTCLCNALRCCNHLSLEQATAIVSANRLNSYIKQGVIERLNTVTPQGQAIAVYSLTSGGRGWIDKHIPEMRNQSYYTSATAPLHNIALAEQYLQPNRGEWLTERDLRSILMETISERDNAAELLEMVRSGAISVPDGGYRTAEGHTECVEIINSHYGTAEIAAKEAFTELTGLAIEFIRQ